MNYNNNNDDGDDVIWTSNVMMYWGAMLFVFLLEFGFTHNYISQLRHDVNIIIIARHHKK